MKYPQLKNFDLLKQTLNDINNIIVIAFIYIICISQ